MDNLTKSIVYRFLRGAIAGATGTMIVILPASASVSGWNELGVWLTSLVLAGIVGFISGTIQAVDKYVRSKDIPLE